jgi:hypothetical protein
MKKRTTAVMGTAALIVPTTAGATTIQIVNRGYVRTAAFQAAAGQVANNKLRSAWRTGRITWGRTGGMALVLLPNLGAIAKNCGRGVAACHGVLTSGEPVALVDTNRADTGVPWTVAASHELFEMIEDPFLDRTTMASDGTGDLWLDEVADPVEDYRMWVRGVPLSDFVYPAWFRNTYGRQDALGWLDDSTAGQDVYEFSCPSGYAQYLDVSTNRMKLMGGDGCTGNMQLRPGHDGLRYAHASATGFRLVGDAMRKKSGKSAALAETRQPFARLGAIR